MLLAILLSGAQPALEEMLLICDGASVGDIVTSRTNGVALDSRGNVATGTAATIESGSVEFQVQFRTRGDIAEMNVPGGAAPWWSGGKAGWYPVKRLSITDDEITGRVQFNLLTSSSFHIDRRTGSITTKSFSGICRKQDLTQRAF